MTGPSKGREMTAAEWAKLDACQRLEVIEFALVKLGAGEKRVEIRHGEYYVRYHDGSVPFLERERARLSAICTRRRAITVGWR